MSQFLGFESFLIALGASLDDTKNTLKAAFTGRAWQCVNESVQIVAALGTLGTLGSNANAFDLDPGTYCYTANALPLWVGCQASSGFTPTKLTLHGGPTITENPKNFTLDYSDNGTVWATLQTFTNETGWVPYGKRNYAISGAASHAYWRINITEINSANNTGNKTLANVILENAAGQQLVSNTYFLDIIPPATETIGNANAFEFTRLRIAPTTISAYAMKRWIAPQPQQVSVANLTAGAVTCSLSISTGTNFAVTASFAGSVMTVTNALGVLGVGSPIFGPLLPTGTYIASLGTGAGGNGTYNLSTTPGTIASNTFQAQAVAKISYTGIAANTSTNNLEGLYGAIRDSADPTFAGWTWDLQYPAQQNGDDLATYIYGINNTAEVDHLATGVNVTVAPMAYFIGAGFQTDEAIVGSPSTLTIDLVNGFVYYLQVNARGFALATKTNAGYYGPTHACWGLNSAALAYMPIDNQFLTPIELVVGYDNDYTTMGGVGKTSSKWELNRQAWANTEFRTNYYGTPPTRGFRRQRFTDIVCNTYSTDNNIMNGLVTVPLLGSSIWNGDQQVGNDFQVHRVKSIGMLVGYGGSAANGFATGFLPGFEIDDWYKFRGTATNESLLLIADTVGTTKLASNYTPGDAVLNCVDASGLQTVGFVVINNEVLQYTGKSGNQLTGITGGKYASQANRHYAGDTVGQGMWFCIINGGALFAGYVKPS